MKLSYLFGVGLGLALLSSVEAAEKAPAPHPFAFEDMMAVRRVSDSQVSPDGNWVVFAERVANLEKNNFVSHLWIVPSSGGTPWRLTNHEKGESSPKWSPDGRTIAFLSSRSGSQQVWTIPVGGGEATQVTKLSTDVDNLVWSKTGAYLAFSSDVFPGVEGDEAQKGKQKERDDSGVKAEIFDTLLYRHWKDWRHGKRAHTFVFTLRDGSLRDVTPGDVEAPPFELGGPAPFDFSPDDSQLVLSKGPTPDTHAWTTDANLFLVDLRSLSSTNHQSLPSTNITAANKGWDGSPVWSPNGRLIAYRAQLLEGYEADKFRVALYDLTSRQTIYLTEKWDRSVDEIAWAPDSQSLFVEVQERGESAIYRIPVFGEADPARFRKVYGRETVGGLSVGVNGRFLIAETQSFTAPTEVARIDLGDPATADEGRLKRLTQLNGEILDPVIWPTISSVTYPGALGESIQAWLVKPADFKAGDKAPFVLWIHGGPQSAWKNAFSYRWNPALLASKGYVVLMPNPHGSTGFGQAFTRQISEDWGGACYEDLMKGVDWAVQNGLADPDRMAAAGGSFGGYMVNWILGHNKRFKALISHAGVYNLESMYGVTEELWFAEWDLGGTPWKNKGAYEKFSPHRFAANFSTPTLVIHGELDFRVPVGEGMQLFTALKRQGVESKFLYFPDEGHWVLKPKNAKLWNETFAGWLDQHLKAK